MRTIIIIGALAFLCAGGAFQEEQVIRDLIARMGDEAPSARDAAENRIVEIGPATLPLLAEAVKSADDSEIVSRAKRAIERINYQEKVKAVCGPVRRVTIDVAKRPLGQVVAEIEQQTKEAIIVDDALKSLPVTLTVKDEPYLKVLHRVATETPGIRLDLGKGKVSLRAGPFDGRTAHSADRIVVKAKSVRSTRNFVDGSMSGIIVTFALASPGGNVPAAYEFHLKDFVRSTAWGGHVRWDDNIENIFFESEAYFLMNENLSSEKMEIIIKGNLSLYYVIEKSAVELAMPSESGGNSSIALDNRDKIGLHFTGGNDLQVEYSYALPDEDTVVPICLFRRQALDVWTNIKAFNDNNEEMLIESAGSGSSLDSRRRTRYINHRWEGAPPVKIRVTLPDKIHTEEVPFEITVPLK